MKKLIDLLTAKTERLKANYLDKTLDHARREFEEISSRSSWSHEDWKKIFGGGKYGLSKKAHNKRDQFYKVVKMGEPAYVKAKVLAAEKHYEASILKLAVQIQDKGLNLENLTMVEGHVGLNFETTITDGALTVRAFTILACGPVNAPHYRYLIK